MISLGMEPKSAIRDYVIKNNLNKIYLENEIYQIGFLFNFRGF